MIISLNWLNRYLDRPSTPDEIDEVLTAAGFPIEGVETLDDDVQIDVEVTSNRPDMLSHLGVARELAAHTNRELQIPEVTPAASGPEVTGLTSVKIEASEQCPVYTARVIKGVKVGPSPEWLVSVLEAVGLRSVNNVVDVTNFVLLETGQPLHAFDMALLKEGRIVVRQAKEKEDFLAIDESVHKLNPPMLVIADAEKAVAVAGVMGGKDSEVTESTVDILLESATFDPLSTRKTSRGLKLSSDSSYRFERGVDLKGIEWASQRACQLILELAGGELASGVIRVGDEEPEAHQVSMRLSRAEQLLGVAVTADAALGYLGQLGLSPAIAGDVITCTIPSFRLDLEREIDLIEEVARLYGYENIPIDPKVTLDVRPPQGRVVARKKLGQVLSALGFYEAINFSNCEIRQAKPFTEGLDLVLIPEDKKKKEPALRPSVLPGLLACRKHNQDAGAKAVKLYEVASTFGQKDGAYVQGRQLGLIMDVEDPTLTLRQMRGAMEALLNELGVKGWKFEALKSLPAWADVAGRYVSDAGVELGRVGLLNTATLKCFDLKVAQVAGELDYEALLAAWPRIVDVEEAPRFPAIERDLSVIVQETIGWMDIEQLVLGLEPDLMEQVEFVTSYRGKPIPKGQKSVSLRLMFRDPEKTLRHEEVDGQMATVMDALKTGVKAEIRTQ